MANSDRSLGNFPDDTALAAGNAANTTGGNSSRFSPSTIFMIVLGLLIWLGTEALTVVVKRRKVS